MPEPSVTSHPQPLDGTNIQLKPVWVFSQVEGLPVRALGIHTSSVSSWIRFKAWIRRVARGRRTPRRQTGGDGDRRALVLQGFSSPQETSSPQDE